MEASPDPKPWDQFGHIAEEHWAGELVPTRIIDAESAALVKQLVLPDDWRERLDEMGEYRDERENLEGKRDYLKGKLQRLRELYVDGYFAEGEYNRRKEGLQAQLDALVVPERPAIKEAGETLEELGAIWASAPLRIQRDMLRVIFEAVYVDVLAQRLVCAKPYPQFAPLFRMDGLKEKGGCFYVGEEGQEARPQD